MSVFVDTTILVDLLCGRDGAVALSRSTGLGGAWQASEITRLDVLAGMRPRERRATADVLSLITWHDIDQEVAEAAGEPGRAWLPSHPTIDAADLAITATATLRHLPLLTLNVRRFPMMKDLSAPY